MNSISYSELETPCYILKEEELLKNITSFQEALNSNFSKSILSYSVKTNSFPYLLEVLLKNKGFAEVVSHDEYDWVRLLGFPINNIIYNGPAKSKESFIEAVSNGAIVNIETLREIEWLKDLDKSKIYQVGIRVNIDLGIVSLKDSKDNEDYSRFGFSYESGDLHKALETIKTLENINVTGLHAHRTSATRSVHMYEGIATYVSKLINEFKLELEYLDLGGGFYGIMSNKPTYSEYCTAIRKALSSIRNIDKLTIIVEPGNAIVASAFDFVTTVIDKKNIRDFVVLTTDGSRNDVDPFFKKSSYFYELDLVEIDKREIANIQQVNGCSCLEYDKMFVIENKEELVIGDKIKFNNVGAYTMTMSPLFIRLFPNVYLFKNDETSLLREKFDAKVLGYNYFK